MDELHTQNWRVFVASHCWEKEWEEKSVHKKVQPSFHRHRRAVFFKLFACIVVIVVVFLSVLKALFSAAACCCFHIHTTKPAQCIMCTKFSLRWLKQATATTGERRKWAKRGEKTQPQRERLQKTKKRFEIKFHLVTITQRLRCCLLWSGSEDLVLCDRVDEFGSFGYMRAFFFCRKKTDLKVKFNFSKWKCVAEHENALKLSAAAGASRSPERWNVFLIDWMRQHSWGCEEML